MVCLNPHACGIYVWDCDIGFHSRLFNVSGGFVSPRPCVHGSMMFWLTVFALTLFVAVPIARAMGRGQSPQDDGANVAFYCDQLAEIDRDVARGVLDEDEADRARLEVQRRLLASDAASAQRSVPSARTRYVMPFIVVAGLLGGAGAIYSTIGAPGYGDLPLADRIAEGDARRTNRPSQAAMVAAAPAPNAVDADPAYLDLVAKLRLVMLDRPDDIAGWQLLAQHEARLGNFANAADAADQVIAIKAGDATVDDQIIWIDRAVAAAGGLVSPEVEDRLRQILVDAPGSLAARYYLGLLYAQTDRPDLAFRFWRSVVEADVPSPHTTLARQNIEEAAFRAGSDYTLPETNAAPSGNIDSDDIQNMVSGLASRLATQGGSAREWARLIRSYGVLNQLDAAAEVWAEAQTTFAASPEAISILREAASQAGVLQ